MSTSAVSAPFWAAAAREELVVPTCDECGARFFVPEVVCPACFSDTWTWQASPGTGVIYSYSVVQRAADPAYAGEVPYVLVVVDLDDGWSMLGRLVDVSLDAVAIGASVQVRFAAIDGRTVPVFAPADAGGE